MLTNISGFPEFLPEDQIAFNKVMQMIKSQFELYGFAPLDTPAVEKVSTLLSKGNDNEIYGIYRLSGEEGNKKDLALRFDLTVPLARYVSQNYGKLTFPYKRYHIAPVWRGERAQAGRYRQFYQCDIDVIGDGDLSLFYDAEVLSVAYKIFQNILPNRFVIKINNRYVLTGLIKSFGASDDDLPSIMRSLDKAEKISSTQLESELSALKLSNDAIAILMELISKKMANHEWIKYLRNLCTHDEFIKGLNELEETVNICNTFGVSKHALQIDPSLARGLNYYTGSVFETKLLDYPELGSVCGGGRYANLVSNFTNKQLPGVGISIGISRLIPKLIETGIIKTDSQTPATVIVTSQNRELIPEYIKITNLLRNAGINTEIYLSDKSLASQMKYASKKGIQFAIIADQQEIEQKLVIVRDLITGHQNLVTPDDLICICNQINL